MGPGIDLVAHFDQQGDVVAGPEAGIQAKDRRHRRRIGRILVFKTLQACMQPGFLSLDQDDERPGGGQPAWSGCATPWAWRAC